MSYDLKTAEAAAYSPFFGYMGAASAQVDKEIPYRRICEISELTI